jgi:hypothetical protein
MVLASSRLTHGRVASAPTGCSTLRTRPASPPRVLLHTACCCRLLLLLPLLLLPAVKHGHSPWHLWTNRVLPGHYSGR